MSEEGRFGKLREAFAPRYRLVRELGRGGAARVYLAREPKHDRDVAIKVLDPEVAASSGTERFLREIRTTAQLSHPHILPLLDSGEVEGLLFYVTPYVSGGSLRDRLGREGPLALSEVVRLATEIARALQTAHVHGHLHRDIKPANILLEEDQAVVADFGIVRALSRLADTGQTTEGVVLGTPVYMSPEQATGEGEGPVDERSDVYGLACVVYEALVGEPPFTGATSRIVLARKMTGQPVPPSKCRPGLPEAVDVVIERALAPASVDRFRTPRAFAEALADAASEEAGAAPWRRLGLVATAAALLGLFGWVVVPRLTTADPPGDASRWVLLSSGSTAVGAEMDAVDLLRDAILRWSDIGVVDPLQVRDRLQGTRPPTDVSAAAAIARDLGAGRFVRLSVSEVGDTFRIHGGLYTPEEDGRLLYDEVVRAPVDGREVRRAFEVLADQLLFQGRLGVPGASPRGTRSVSARVAFEGGRGALGEWSLARADSAFSEATEHDPAFGAAHLWLALTRAWAGRPVSRWEVALRQAELRRNELSPRDELMREALAAEAGGELGLACPRWGDLARRDPDDWAAWYSLALCLATDNRVVEDPDSPSGWSFRTSYHMAVEAYRRAFRLHPAILSSFRESSYEDLMRVLKASGNQRRNGESMAEVRFAADPAWRGDSLALVPWPLESVRDRLTVGASEFQLALRHTREIFRDIASTWAAEEPGSADARVALSLALTMLGDASGLDTLRAARSLATGPAQRRGIRVLDVWLQLALALPFDQDGVRSARALADSLLASEPLESGDPELMAGLAALTGRGHQAVALASDPGATGDVFAPPLRRSGPRLMVYAALGGPVDSIAVLERRMWSIVRNELGPDQRERALIEWVGRPASLAFPTYRFETLDSLVGRGDWLVDAQAELARGDSIAARATMSRVAEGRRLVPPASLTWDGLLPEASLLHELGEVEAAAGWIDPTLETLSRASPQVLATPERAATLVRGMALRSRLALEMGDAATAVSWARPVVWLWSDADPFLQPMVDELRVLSETGADPRDPAHESEPRRRP